MYLCPVCGYDRLEDPPKNFAICPSCGTEFGYGDAFLSLAQLRATWLRNGANWWSSADPQPMNWDPYVQVSRVAEASLIWQKLFIGTQSYFAPIRSMNVGSTQQHPSVPDAVHNRRDQLVVPYHRSGQLAESFGSVLGFSKQDNRAQAA